MAPDSNAETLTPLDLIMPRTYQGILLTFRTTKELACVKQNLQSALDAASKLIPWISGRVVPVTSATTKKPGLELQWDSDWQPPILKDLGEISAAYDQLVVERMPLDAIPRHIWPVADFIDEQHHNAGALAFAAGLFSFADHRGIGLVLCVHHNVTDARGLVEIARLWTQNIAGIGSSVSFRGRSSQLSEELSADLAMIQHENLADLVELHPEYSMAPPAMPSEFPACTSKLLSVSTAKLRAERERLRIWTRTAPSTNTVACAFLWSAITRVRTRTAELLSTSNQSRLATAVDGRKRLNQNFSNSGNPYFGNVVLYSLAELPVIELTQSEQSSPQKLAAVCDAISDSISPDKIDSRHIAETYSLVTKAPDYRNIFIGWNPFMRKDLTITSWANMEWYALDFGPNIGKPDFVRVPGAAADGVCIILPLKKETAENQGEEMIDILVMLERDDMAALEEDAVWKSLAV